MKVSKFLQGTIIDMIVDIYDVSRKSAKWAISQAHSWEIGKIREWINRNTKW